MRQAERQAFALLEANDLTAFEALLRARPVLVRVHSEADQDTLLHGACHRKSLRAAELLLQLGADPNARGLNGQTPLHAAVSDASAKHALPMVRILIASGAKPSIRDDSGFDALAWAKQELWTFDDELFTLLGAEPGSVVEKTLVTPYSYAATPPAVRAIEAQGHTEVDVFKLIRAFIAGENVDVDDTTWLGAASDRDALKELAMLLSLLNRTRWKEPVKRLLATHFQATDARALVTHYFEVLRSEH